MMYQLHDPPLEAKQGDEGVSTETPSSTLTILAGHDHDVPYLPT